MARRQLADGAHLVEDVVSGEVIGDESSLSDDRPWAYYYNIYGDRHRLPADAVQMSLLMQGGWSLYPPQNPLPKPTSQKMRNGTVFEFSSTAGDLTEAEKRRLDRVPGEVVQAVPTVTYYTKSGTPVEGLADPESMMKYLEMGLTLDPPVSKPEPKGLVDHLELGGHELLEEDSVKEAVTS